VTVPPALPVAPVKVALSETELPAAIDAAERRVERVGVASATEEAALLIAAV